MKDGKIYKDTLTDRAASARKAPVKERVAT